MKIKFQSVIQCIGLGVCLMGSLALWPTLASPALIKAPLLALGLLILVLAGHIPRVVTLQSLVALLFFLLLLAMRGNHPSSGQAATLAVVGAMAYLIGSARLVIPPLIWMAGLWVVLIRGILDLLTLNPLGHPRDVVTSFFMDRHAFAGILLCALFALFYQIDAAVQKKTKFPNFTYLTLLVTLIALLICDSRSAQGTFFLLFLPLLFLSVRLDFKEPQPERLFWVAGLALCTGIVWLNLPERQLGLAMNVFTDSPMLSTFHREWAWDIFTRHFWFGLGTGALQWSHSDVLSADSHFLQRLAENGFIGLCLEALLIGLALMALGPDTLRSSRPGPRIICFSLLALGLHGLFTSALESAPLFALYCGFIGYGGSFSTGKTFGTLGKRRYLLLTLLTVAVAMSGFRALQEMRAEHLYQKALIERRRDRFREYTNDLAAALKLQPSHPLANYAYAEVLARFSRGDEARTRLDALEKSIPDPSQLALTRAQIRILEGLPGMATIELEPIMAGTPPPLEAFELQIHALAASDCISLEKVKADSLTWLRRYPWPDASRYTLEALTEAFNRGDEVNFLQRAFGGRLLRQRFIERQMNGFHQQEWEHQRVKDALATPCQVP